MRVTLHLVEPDAGDSKANHHKQMTSAGSCGVEDQAGRAELLVAFWCRCCLLFFLNCSDGVPLHLTCRTPLTFPACLFLPRSVTMFEPRSYLEKLADPWRYPKYLSLAAATQDPLQRMKLVVAWFLAGGRA